MVIDSSALLAVLLQEPAAQRISNAIEAADVRLISAVNALEAAMVIEARNGMAGARDLDRLLLDIRVEIVPATAEHFDLARSAWRRYGKGRHPARLNICDCLAYAVSKATGEPLLFVGGDFAKTDVAVA